MSSHQQDPLRVGLVGAGMIGTLFGEALAALPDAELRGVATSRPDTAQAFAGRYDVPFWTADYRELLGRDDIDAVCVLTPPESHAEIAIAAAGRGKHVLVEKPMASTVAEADAMIAAADAAHVRLGVIFMYRFMDAALEMKRIVDAGLLGRLVLAECVTRFHRTPEYYSTRPWRALMGSGGVLSNNAIHHLDLLLWLLGPVESVSGFHTTRTHDIAAEDTAVGSLRFADGVLASVTASTAVGPGVPRRIELAGTDGWLRLEEDRLSASDSALLTGPAATEDTDLGSSFAAPGRQSPENHRRQLADFLAAIRDKRAPAVDGHEGRRALACVHALYASCREGRTIPL